MNVKSLQWSGVRGALENAQLDPKILADFEGRAVRIDGGEVLKVTLPYAAPIYDPKGGNERFLPNLQFDRRLISKSEIPLCILGKGTAEVFAERLIANDIVATRRPLNILRAGQWFGLYEVCDAFSAARFGRPVAPRPVLWSVISGCRSAKLLAPLGRDGILSDICQQLKIDDLGDAHHADFGDIQIVDSQRAKTQKLWKYLSGVVMEDRLFRSLCMNFGGNKWNCELYVFPDRWFDDDPDFRELFFAHAWSTTGRARRTVVNAEVGRLHQRLTTPLGSSAWVDLLRVAGAARGEIPSFTGMSSLEYGPFKNVQEVLQTKLAAGNAKKGILKHYPMVVHAAMAQEKGVYYFPLGDGGEYGIDNRSKGDTKREMEVLRASRELGFARAIFERSKLSEDDDDTKQKKKRRKSAPSPEDPRRIADEIMADLAPRSGQSRIPRIPFFTRLIVLSYRPPHADE